MTTSTTHHNAFIFHGYAAAPTDHWFEWLARQLHAVGFTTSIPELPDSLAPDAIRWQDSVRAAIGEPNAGTVVVAHSLGCLAVLRRLVSLSTDWHLGNLVLVSGFLDALPALPELDAFIGDGCDVSGLADRIDRVTVIRSDDDVLVPPAHTDRLAGLLGVTPTVVSGAGHFLAADGHTSLPAAHAAILS